jgi:hypothetical protein
VAQASHEAEARPIFRVLAGVLFAFGAAALLISIVLIIVSRDWWPLSIILGSLPLTYWCWRIARRGRM